MTRAKSPAAGGEAFAHHAEAPTDEKMRFELSRTGARKDTARDGITIGATIEIKSRMSATARQGVAMRRARPHGDRACVGLNQRA